MENIEEHTPFDGKRPTGYVKLNAELLRPDIEYGIINLIGNCMDSDLSPKRIKHGDKLLIHAIPVTEPEIIRNIKKIVCFRFANGEMFTKQLVFYSCGCMVVRMFKPHEMFFYIPINKIKSLFVVDDVFSPEYIKQNLCSGCS